jgi:hypothetical protein
MTEGGNKRDQDMYARQALLGGRKVPFIYNLESPVLQLLHNEADVDVGLQGSHSLGIPNAETMEDLEKIAWAPRYMRCGNEIKKEVCKPHDYSGVCWIERPDGFTPPTSQNAEPGGRASWHPGDKVHRLTGRGVTFMILRALHESLVMWSAADGQVLPDSAWHVTEYYETMKQKIRDSDADITGCGQYKDLGMPFFCNLPVKVRVCRLSLPWNRMIIQIGLTRWVAFPLGSIGMDSSRICSPLKYPLPDGTRHVGEHQHSRG